jgi:hypothetical protein
MWIRISNETNADPQHSFLDSWQDLVSTRYSTKTKLFYSNRPNPRVPYLSCALQKLKTEFDAGRVIRIRTESGSQKRSMDLNSESDPDQGKPKSPNPDSANQDPKYRLAPVLSIRSGE